MNWFECKVSYDKTMENGIVKKVTEAYLVDAFSHAEAEARIIEEMRSYIAGEFAVSAVRRVNYSEIFTDDSSDKYWKGKVSFISLDEKSGAEKRINTSMITQGDSIEEAIENINKGMKSTMDDYEITEVKQSNILEIFLYARN